MPLLKKKLMKTEWRPRPHDAQIGWAFEMDDLAIDTTEIPIIRYDEGLGAPDTYNSHPEHASFVTASEPNCFVKSRVDNIFAKLQLNLTSKFYDDNLSSIRLAFMVISSAFKNKLDETDEKSTQTVKGVLELQYETTDRQTYPLYNGTDMAIKPVVSSDLPTNAQTGLTTDGKLEGVSFAQNTFYDAIHYFTIADLIKNMQSGLKWVTLTPDKPFMTIPIHQKSASKRMNPYTHLTLLVHCPLGGSIFQPMTTTRDITAATQYVDASVWYRYNEWHQNFDHEVL